MIDINKTQRKILIFLATHPEKQFTIRGISRELDKPYPLIYNNIKKLESFGFVIRKSIPPAQSIELNEHAPLSLMLQLEFERKEIFLAKYPWVRVMLNDLLSRSKTPFLVLLVFGSYAKETQTSKSDIDLLFISMEKSDFSDIENAAKVYTKVKKGINIVDINDFKEMIKTDQYNIGNEAKKHHIILFGADMFYYLVR